MEVLYIDILVWSSLTLTPEKETFLGGCFFDWDVLDGESENDSPNHTYISNVMRPLKNYYDDLPNVILTFPSTISSAPIETSLTPLDWMKSRALLTLAILWNRILPRSGFGRRSPEITSKSNINLRPLRKSTSMASIPVPALRKWELHHAVKVWKIKFNR